MPIGRQGFINILLIALVVVLVVVLGYIILVKKVGLNPEEGLLGEEGMPSPITCIDKPEGIPIITWLSNHSGPVGTKLEINGCNFLGFEGDKNAWIENSNGVKGLLRGEAGSTGKLIKATLSSPLCSKDTSYSGLPCDASLTLVSGSYRIYVMPWGKKSNEVGFTIK